jgi:hypothetical protein
MDKTVEDIKADIARLREHVSMYRKLAEERRAVDHMRIADKLTEAANECEAMARELEGKLRGPAVTNG